MFGVFGIIAIASGVFALSTKEKGGALNLTTKAIVLCLFAGSSVALYTILDGVGVRIADTGITLRSIATFAAWLFVFDGIGMMLFMLWYRGPKAFTSLSKTGLSGVFAGCTAFTCFWIAIWAFAHAPVAVVAALRETSVLFSLVLGRVYLSEAVSLRRVLLATLVLFGIIMLRFA